MKSEVYMPIKKVQSEFEKLTDILANGVIADECTAGELKTVHDQLQQAILSRDPAKLIQDKKITEQLVEFEETNPIAGKFVKDLINALSGMGI
jgi:non-homologous end joining protein Ku